jgi:hypothetical protein
MAVAFVEADLPVGLSLKADLKVGLYKLLRTPVVIL